MKKRVMKALVMMIAVISLITAFAFNSSAGNFYDFDWQYTAVTNTVGKSGADFYGTGATTFGIVAYCQGGSTSNFVTYLHVRYYDNQGTTLDEVANSNSEGTRLLEREVSKSTANYNKTGKGWAEFSCVSKTDSSDKWEVIYQHNWVGGSTGWRDY